MRFIITGAWDEISLLLTMLPPAHRVLRQRVLDLVILAPANTTLPAFCRLFPTLTCKEYGHGGN